MLDFNSPEPLHVQVKAKLREEIVKGKYNGKIPSERELIDQYSVSRTTIRIALSDLVHEGLLEKRHGKGTFVTSVSVQDWLGSFRSLTETVKSMGMKPGTKLLYQGVQTTPRKVRDILEVDQFYKIERLRYADHKPIAIEKHYYPLEIGNQLKEYDLNQATLYDLLQENLGINLWRASQIIMGEMPTNQDAKNLELKTNSGVLVSERIMMDLNEKPVEFLKSIYNPSMYAFRIDMTQRR